MRKAVSVAISEPIEARARQIAHEDNRSLAEVVENALSVFTAMPKELRDALMARLAIGGPEDTVLLDASRDLRLALARRRIESTRECW